LLALRHREKASRTRRTFEQDSLVIDCKNARCTLTLPPDHHSRAFGRFRRQRDAQHRWAVTVTNRKQLRGTR
jgi:hypothetical protein